MFTMNKKQTPTPRHVHVAACVDAQWEREGRHRFELGFLIGQSDLVSSPANDVVLAAVEVPAEEPDLDHDVEIVQSFEDLSVDWVQEIAKQVDRLLPGGVQILGLYVVSAADARSAIDQASVYLRAIASTVALPSECMDAKSAQVDEHHCIVHICTKTNTKSVTSYANMKDVARTATVPAELRSPTASTELLRVDKYTASVALAESIAFSSVQTRTPSAAAGAQIAEKRVDELQQQLQPLVQSVWKARGIAAGDPHQIELVAPSREAAGIVGGGQCRGVVQCVAFVRSSTPRALELATYYLKRDFVKSLVVRLELLLERLSEDTAAGPALLALRDGGTVALPKRGLMKWCSGATQLTTGQRIQLSLHAFADDDQLHAVQAALEILSAGDELAGADIDQVATSLTWLESDSEQPRMATPLAQPVVAAPSKASGSSISLLFIAVPLLLLVVAYVLAQQRSS